LSGGTADGEFETVACVEHVCTGLSVRRVGQLVGGAAVEAVRREERVGRDYSDFLNGTVLVEGLGSRGLLS
jgi:hypothetical protein